MPSVSQACRSATRESVIRESATRESPIGRFSLLRPLRIQGVLAALMVASGLLAASASTPRAHEFKAGAIEIDHPWARATPGGATVGGGYAVLKNNGTTADRLVSAAAPFAGRVELHEMAVKDGVMTMRPLPEGIALPAGATVALKPGAYHIMFLELKQPLKEGELLDGTLTFEAAGVVPVKFKVESIAAGAGAAATAPAHSGH
ncbi:copper chaperone PCu(A)C [Xanthobacter sp. V4C-4]|uniref:copper chaperone PCu(A)C n=1 Tax=Xanthobacter cornucopiae TaxID=3119924 RepID=UPI003728F9E8